MDADALAAMEYLDCARAIGPVDLGIIERLTPLFMLSGPRSLGVPPKNRNMPKMRAGPIRQLLRTGRLCVGEV